MRRRFRDVVLPMAVYAAILMSSGQFLQSHAHSPWRIPAAVAPVVPIAFVALTGIRRVRDMDELHQRKYLEAGTFAYLATVMLSITYGFLQNAGLPALNWMLVGVCMFLLFGLGQMLAWSRYR